MSLPVDKIENHKYKSWKESSNLGGIEFNQFNILFGHNGAGKSSLAGGIAKTYLVNNDKNTARFFSSKYAEGTLLLEDKSGIRGVVSNFGEKDVDIEKQIDRNNKSVESIKMDLEKQSDDRERLVKSTELLIKDIVKRRKDKNKNIHNKPENKTIQEKILLWEKDYDDARKMFPDEDYNVITGNADFSAESERLNLLTIPALPVIDKDSVSNLAGLLRTEYKSMDIPEHEVVNWLESGLHIHEQKHKCEFCGSNIDIDKITKRVNAFVNNEKHQAILALQVHKQNLEGLRELAKSVVDNKDNYSQILGYTDGLNFSEIESSFEIIKTNIDKNIDGKIKAMGTSFVLDEDSLTKAMDKITDSVSILETSKKQTAQNLLEKINRLETLVKGAIGLEIQSTQTITDNLSKLDSLNDRLLNLTEKQKKLQAKNEGLLSQKSDLSDFATFLNQVLDDLNLNFKLAPSGKVFVLQHADGGSLKLDDISDGERNLLSLVYFYYEMLGDSAGTFKGAVKIIIIDDPVSSLDDNNKFYITELMKSILGQNAIQVFILTHSWDDFCNLSYGCDTEKTSLFEIKKMSGISSISKISNQKLIKPYITLYREVNEFRQTDPAVITDETALHMPNTMRRVLEEYIKFRVNVDFATASHNGDISKALFSEELATLSNSRKQKLNQLLAICNILSHKAGQPKNPSEIHESAKFLIGSIEQNDKYHHLKMRGD